MENIYTSYKCKICKCEFVLLTEDIESMNIGSYISCPYCHSKNIRKQQVTDNLKECMSQRSYKRKHGALVQQR